MKTLLLCSLALLTCSCQTVIKSDKIVSVKQRCFGIVIGENPSTQVPEIHLGFVSTVWQVIPTSTNGPVYVPSYADTFDLHQGLNPFATGITENTGTGEVVIGTNGAATTTQNAVRNKIVGKLAHE